jgi:shikimate dehydrogenase
MKTLSSISTKTRFCAVIGNPVAHSLSPAIHNAGYEALGLDFVYVACQVEDLQSALTGMRALGNFRGMSVTIPHKIEAMKYVDEVAEIDQSIGSINTVIHDGNKLSGLGTDGPGALKALSDSGVQIDGKNVLMLGAGGAARAIAFTLAGKTALNELKLLDINESLLSGLSADLKARTKAKILSASLNPDSLENAMATADVILHCTSVGMHPKEDNSLVPVELFRPGQSVLDIVYNPLETKLLKDAASRGVKVVSGVEMFLNQAAIQFKHFTGENAPLEVMRKVLMEHLKA